MKLAMLMVLDYIYIYNFIRIQLPHFSTSPGTNGVVLCFFRTVLINPFFRFLLLAHIMAYVDVEPWVYKC